MGISFELNLQEVNDAMEVFQVELDLKYTWIAANFAEVYERHKKPPPNSKAFDEMVKEIWMPQLRIQNLAGNEEVASSKILCFDTSKGLMHKYLKLRVTCAESLELHRFPFDRQLLAIVITSWRDTSEVTFVPYPGRVSLARITASRWKLVNAESPMLVIPAPESAGLRATSGRSYHRAIIVLEAERDWHWYMLRTRWGLSRGMGGGPWGHPDLLTAPAPQTSFFHMPSSSS